MNENQKKKVKSVPKRILRVIALIVAVVLLAVLGYVAYVLIDYHRLGNMPLEVNVPADAAEQVMKTGEVYRAFTWNIGFGAYTADYDFFMDGGNQSRAVKDRLEPNLRTIAALSAAEKADLYLFEEVDIGGTRTWDVNEVPYLTGALPKYNSVFAQNYDSPYLMVPPLEPHGANRSGMLTLSRFDIIGAERVELPVENGLTKLLDLDRCYSKIRVKVENDRELILYTFHLSAYTSDGAVSLQQLQLLLKDMQTEYEKGNYCLAGGDFNKDILGNSSEVFATHEVRTWAQPLPENLFDGTDMKLIDPGTDAPTCRNPDSAYHEGQFVVTVDGFIVSDNIRALECRVEKTGFAYSDHEPVLMRFMLQ